MVVRQARAALRREITVEFWVMGNPDLICGDEGPSDPVLDWRAVRLYRRAAMNRKMVALVLSGIFPGLGQLYNRQWVKGAVFVLAGSVLCWLATRALPGDLESLVSSPPGGGVLGEALLLLVVWLWSIVDAWRRA